MVRRLIVLVSALTLVIPSAVLAQNPSPGGSTPDATQARHRSIPQMLPNAIDDSRTVTVMLEMRGDPVAVVAVRRRRTVSSLEGPAQPGEGRAQGPPGRDQAARSLPAAGASCRSSSSPTTASRSRRPRNEVAALASPAERHRGPRHPGRPSRQRDERSVPGHPDRGLGSGRWPRVHRRRREDRRDRHRDRLHPRQLRRPRHGRGLRARERATTRRSATPVTPASSEPMRPRSRAASISSAMPTTAARTQARRP